MINIAHPQVSSKPPLNKFCASRTIGRKLATLQSSSKTLNTLEQDETNICTLPTPTKDSETNEAIGNADSTIRTTENDVQHLNPESDRNQNVVQPDSSSFDQLCKMINDLEQNIPGESSAINRQMDSEKTRSQFPDDFENILSQKYLNQDEPEKDGTNSLCISNRSTYEDIMSFLGTLEQDTVVPEFYTRNEFPRRPESRNVIGDSETLKKELATAHLQLEDREATIKLLKDELKTERKIACEKLDKRGKEHNAEIQTQKTKYQAVVKRHQKFMEQLITEKKDLTEKCNALTHRIREMEAKQQRELKCALERHTVELQRAKELCMASEKIRRERWLEAKTSKIKEMTVKGLEPELRSMVEQHQQELQDIRSTHMQELQDVELRTIRRSNQQLEQLRLELTASHDKIVANEREALRVRFQEKFDEQEALSQAQQRKFFEDLQQERKKFAEERTRRDAERDFVLKQSAGEFQEKIEMLNRQHRNEKRALAESLQGEREAWIENYRRQQNSKFEITQARIMDDCNKERDRQIELAIARLEKETRDTKGNLQKNWENKLRCTKEKYESELQDANERLESAKEKFAAAQQKLEAVEEHVENTESRLNRCLHELCEAKQSVQVLTRERDQAKKIARQEIESEKRELEEKIASLYREITENNANRDTVMAQLYSRIKLIVTQKDMTIKNITREANEMKRKCEHLEKLLDQQRKEYVLKSL